MKFNLGNFFKKLFTSKEPSKTEAEEQSNKDDLTKLASFTSDSIQGQVGIGKLKVEDVAKAFFHLAVSKKTTGAILTVDGGNIAASLR